jgi:hypothetical protein
MGTFEDINTISIQFSNAKIDHTARDTITLDTIFDALQDNIKTDVFDNIGKVIKKCVTKSAATYTMAE